jgi:signal peptidase I
MQECGPKPHVKPGGAACDVAIPRKSSTDFIKRIVAGPGDEIYVRAGHVYRKADRAEEFVRERDPYISACGASTECNFRTRSGFQPNSGS